MDTFTSMPFLPDSEPETIDPQLLPPLVANILPAIRKVQASRVLTPAVKLVLQGILPNLRSETSLAILLAATPRELQVVGGMLTNGILEARNRSGGGNFSFDDAAEVLANFGLLMKKDLAREPVVKRWRGELLSNALLLRQQEHCLVSNGTTSNEGAHILPHAPTAISNPWMSPFWILVTFLYGLEKATEIWSLCGDRNADKTCNGILLNLIAHKVWDQGGFDLIPVHEEPRSMVLRFKITDITVNWQDIVTILPEDLAEQKKGATVAYRSVCDGNLFHTTSEDPEKQPLPGRLLLETRNTLMSTIHATGMLETLKMLKKKRGTLVNAPTSARDPEDEDDRSAKRRRTKSERSIEKNYQSPKTSGSASYSVPHASDGSSRNYDAMDDADEYESEHETLMRYLFGAASTDRIRSRTASSVDEGSGEEMGADELDENCALQKGDFVMVDGGEEGDIERALEPSVEHEFGEGTEGDDGDDGEEGGEWDELCRVKRSFPSRRRFGDGA